MAGFVSTTINDGVATITMDDGKANALSLTMSQALGLALDRARSEANLVVIRGRPGILCAGFDLNVIRGGDAAQRSAMTEAGMALLARLYLLPQPLIVATSGHAVAAGAMMLLAGDIRIGRRGPFRIGLNETAIGLALPQLGIELARDRLLPTVLTEALLSARLYAPDDAARAGYLDQAVDATDFEMAVADAAAALAKPDVSAFAETKSRLRRARLASAGAG